MAYRLKKFSWQTIALVVAVLAIVVFFFIKSTQKPAATPSDTTSSAPTAVMAVEVTSPVVQSVELTLPASGVIAGKEVAQVGARVNGVAIEQILVAVGDFVQAGQPLALLDNSVAIQQSIASNAELAQATVALQKAEADLARVEPLMAIDAISRAQYDSYQVAKAQAEANVVSAQARLNSTQTSELYSQVLAPVSGVVSKKMADVGMLTTGAPLFEIVKDGVLEWQASISPLDAQQISVGQRANVFVGGEVVSGVVTKIAPVANNSRELTVHTMLDNNRLLHSGMYQTGEFLLAESIVPTLPQQAIISSDGFDYVWVVEPTETELYKAHREQVFLGERVGDVVAVPEFNPEALVVKQGGGFLKEGDLVNVVEPAPISESIPNQSIPSESILNEPILSQPMPNESLLSESAVATTSNTNTAKP